MMTEKSIVVMKLSPIEIASNSLDRLSFCFGGLRADEA